MGHAERDPLAVAFDPAARRLLARVYAAGGGWASTRLADPGPAQIARWLLEGINVTGRDPVPAGGLNGRTRWARAFIRSLWYQHKWYSTGTSLTAQRRTSARHPGIQVEIGPHRQVLGVIPAGYPVRVRLASKAEAASRHRPAAAWAWADGAPRLADPGIRDWAAFG